GGDGTGGSGGEGGLDLLQDGDGKGDGGGVDGNAANGWPSCEVVQLSPQQ
ncbi:hypothetical protein Tco_0414034, partial [Tanacetum coccineum]